MKRLVKATAVIMAAICPLAIYLMETDYWVFALIALAVALGWLMAFVEANLPGFVK